MQTVMSLAVSFERSAVVLKRAMEYTVDDIFRKSRYIISDHAWQKWESASQIATVTDSFTVQVDSLINAYKLFVGYGNKEEYIPEGDVCIKWLNNNKSRLSICITRFVDRVHNINNEPKGWIDSILAMNVLNNYLKQEQPDMYNAKAIMALHQLKVDALCIVNEWLKKELYAIPIMCVPTPIEIVFYQNRDEVKAGKKLIVKVGVNMYQQYLGSFKPILRLNNQNIESDAFGSFTTELDTRGKSGLQKVVAQFSYLDPNTGKPATIQKQIEYNVIP